MTSDPKELRRRYVAASKELKQLKQEICRRKILEKALLEKERHSAGLLERSHQVQERLRHLSHQVMTAQEDERKEISRELHDKVAQILTAINVHLSLLKMEAAGNTAGFKKKISGAQRLLKKSVKIVHQFARDLRPTLLDDIGVVPALNAYVDDFMKHTRIPVRFECSAAVEQLNNPRRTALYRVAQEALVNVAQHAKATRVTITLRKARNAIRMQIKDNGKSFQVERVKWSKKHGALGLLGMRERVEMVGGIFSIQASRGKGTAVQAQVPFS